MKSSIPDPHKHKQEFVFKKFIGTAYFHFMKVLPFPLSNIYFNLILRQTFALTTPVVATAPAPTMMTTLTSSATVETNFWAKDVKLPVRDVEISSLEI